MNETSEKKTILEARDIVKEFPGVRALDGVTFDVRPGEVHALVGENGAGKSTLIKILGGVYPHGEYEGDIFFHGRPARFRSIRDSERAGIGVIHQELLLVKYMTVGENIFLGDEPTRFGMIDYDRMYKESEEIVARLGVSIDVRAEVVNLGVGAQQLVEIAKAVRKNTRVLVLDEPTAALADHEVETLMKLMRELREDGVSLIYISHKLDEVFGIADRITVLRDGKTVGAGDVGEWTRESVVHAMVGRELTDMFPKIEHDIGDTVMEVEALSVEDPELPGRMILDDIGFSVRRGEILGVAGLMGSGRTELLQTLFGVAPGPWRGVVKIDGERVNIGDPGDAIARGLALVPEDRKQQGLALMFPVIENLSMAHLDEFTRAGVVDGAREHRECSRMAREVDIKTPSIEAPVETLSGGNQQKVVLGKWLLKTPKVLLLDEPTRGIDVGAKAEIHRLVGELTQQGMAVIMVSSELPEVLAVSDRIIVLCEGRLTGDFTCHEATPERIMEVAT